MKSTIIESYEDLLKYDDFKSNMFDLDKQDKGYNIYDEKSKLNMYYQLPAGNIAVISTTAYPLLSERFNYISDNNVVVFDPPYSISPSLYIYKKITNDKIYDVANFIASEECYKMVSERSQSYNIYMPSFNGKRTRKILELDEDFNYYGIYNTAAKTGDQRCIIISKLINEFSEMLMKDKESSKLLVDYYFVNKDYSDIIHEFITDSINELSERSYSYENAEADKWLDKQIDEFIKSFNIHFK